MTIDTPIALLGGLSPRVFMRRHWQKKPLLVRQAICAADLAVERSGLFALASREGVESRCATAPSPAGSCRRCRVPTGRCWCKAWICTRRKCMNCCRAFALRRMCGSTT
jgi:hypothetical protein